MLSPTSVLSGGALERRLQPTVAATLQDMPGVAMTSIGPATGRPVVRGLSGDRVLILEDGQRSGDLSSTSGDHAQSVETLSAERIEVVRGPMSLLYGSSALGGVVNVIRNEIPSSVPEHLHGSLVTTLASVNDGVAIGGHADAALGRSLAVRGELSARRGGDFQTPLGDLTNTSGRTISGSGGAALVRDAMHLGAAYRFYDNRYGIPGGYVGGHEEGVDIDMRRHMVRAEGEWHDLGRHNTELRTTAAFSDYRHFELEDQGDIATVFYQRLTAADAVLRHGRIGSAALGALGIRGQYRDIVTGGALRTPSTYDYNLAAFLVEEFGTGPLRFQAGLRYDHSYYVPRDDSAFVTIGGERVYVRPRAFGSFSGSAGVLYELARGVRAGASASRAFRTPDFNELYSNGPHLAANTYDVGDPSLREETGLGADVFLRINRARARIELAAFRNQLDDYIFPSTRGRVEIGRQGGRPRAQFTNEGARFTGFEVEGEWNPMTFVVLDGSMSLVQAVFTTDRAQIPVFNEDGTTSFVEPSLYPPLIPPLMASVGARYERPSWFAGAALRTAGRQDRLSEFETPTAGYGVLGLSAGLRLTRQDRLHAITLRIDNALDKEYRNHLSRIKDIMPEPGRDVSIVYRLTF